MDEEQTAAGLESEFPGWVVWEGVNGRWYGRRLLTSPPWIVRADDPAAVAAKIRRWSGEDR